MSNQNRVFLLSAAFLCVGISTAAMAQVDIECDALVGVDATDTLQLQTACFQVRKLWLIEKEAFTQSEIKFKSAEKKLADLLAPKPVLTPAVLQPEQKAPPQVPEPEWPIFLYSTMTGTSPAATVLYRDGSTEKVAIGTVLPRGGIVKMVGSAFIELDWQGRTVKILPAG